jgi:ABC-2 type transport system ATP-binding protein
MSAIEVKSLTKRIKEKAVLTEINLSIERGKVYGLVGPNASGKTMLLRAFAGLLYISAGSINYQTPMTKGVIIENPEFLNDLTGIENLMYLASIRKVATPESIKKSMSRVQLDPDDSRKVKAYSLGMKQRLAIAQVIMESPDLLLLDEPTRGIDEPSIPAIREIILAEKNRGATILLASHNREDIQELCDFVITLSQGCIVE